MAKSRWIRYALSTRSSRSYPAVHCAESAPSCNQVSASQCCEPSFLVIRSQQVADGMLSKPRQLPVWPSPLLPTDRPFRGLSGLLRQRDPPLQRRTLLSHNTSHPEAFPSISRVNILVGLSGVLCQPRLGAEQRIFHPSRHKRLVPVYPSLSFLLSFPTKRL